ncbi:unnamed protein product, partial [Aphanomyces euteiches]
MARATAPPYVARATDVWALGITMLLGGQFVSLSAGLAAGTVSFGLAIILMGLAYLCFAWSQAEVTSAVPFAGGSYGLARCTLGFYA